MSQRQLYRAVCQKKGGRVFSWMDTIQKRPPGMDISLRQNGAFHLDTRGGEARTVATALRTLPEHPVRPHLTLRHTTPGLTWAGSCLILLLTMALSTCVAPAVQAWVRPGQGVEHSACITGGVCWTPGPPSRGEEGSHGLATESCASQDARWCTCNERIIAELGIGVIDLPSIIMGGRQDGTRLACP